MGTSGPVQRVVIVGGGTAGWMTAAALAKFLGTPKRRILLIESEAIGTVGVGEGTIPPIVEFNALLEIDESEFLRETKATYKLGVEFNGWLEDGNRYFHPFGTIGRPLNGVDLYLLWLRHRAHPSIGPLTAYSMAAAAAAHDRFAHPAADKADPLSGLNYAFHFDAALYGKFLRRFALARGAERIEGKIVAVDQDGESGLVTAVRLDDDRTIRGDLFVDCSGFRSLLLGGAMGVPFEDWGHWLPCDRAIAVPSERTDPLHPFTRSSALSAGWQWRIPLQHRTGNGHVYSSAFMSDDEAERLLIQRLDGKPSGATNRLSFQTGRRSRAWEGNVVGIGLSAGFLEPLESTSIHLIQRSVEKLIALFPDRDISPVERNEYNRHLVDSYDPVRDFLILHYKTTQRTGRFWDHVREMPVPNSLQHKLELFNEHGRIFRDNNELFDVPSWSAVMIGQGLRPNAPDPSADALPEKQVVGAMLELRASYARRAQSLTLASDFIERAIAT